jgi:hypothetical protein
MKAKFKQRQAQHSWIQDLVFCCWTLSSCCWTLSSAEVRQVERTEKDRIPKTAGTGRGYNGNRADFCKPHTWPFTLQQQVKVGSG